MPEVWEGSASKALEKCASALKGAQMKELMDQNVSALCLEFDGIHLDATRQLMNAEAISKLKELAKEREVAKRLTEMFSGAKLNSTEGRSVLHTCLRSAKGDPCVIDGVDYNKEVHEVLGRIHAISEDVRAGKKVGYSGKKLTSVVCIGIGGSYLGVEFVYEALRTEPAASKAANGRSLRFLANVDPIDVSRALEGLCPETTLAIVISKTFTTAETILNARTIREWFIKHYKGECGGAVCKPSGDCCEKERKDRCCDSGAAGGDVSKCVSHHVFAVSTNLEGTEKFGIDSSNVVGFWDWVGGRFSVTSAVGLLPLAIHFGFDIVQEFLRGARSIDQHVLHCAQACVAGSQECDITNCLPGMLAMVSIWNTSYLGHSGVAVLPYCQALLRFPAHIQQLTMESNGKRVTLGGAVLPSGGEGESKFTGEVFFGEPGTNGQHSFYQLLHQGRVVPCEFIGFTKSQQNRVLAGDVVSNHDELMSNFFAQPDALALGKTKEQLEKEGCKPELVPHKTFPGNRPSVSLLFEGHLDAYRTGQLLSIYEHRTAIQGFVWGINSFDQWGVELGKVLAKNVRNCIAAKKGGQALSEESSLPKPTQKLLSVYYKHI